MAKEPTRTPSVRLTVASLKEFNKKNSNLSKFVQGKIDEFNKTKRCSECGTIKK